MGKAAAARSAGNSELTTYWISSWGKNAWCSSPQPILHVPYETFCCPSVLIKNNKLRSPGTLPIVLPVGQQNIFPKEIANPFHIPTLCWHLFFEEFGQRCHCFQVEAISSRINLFRTASYNSAPAQIHYGALRYQHHLQRLHPSWAWRYSRRDACYWTKPQVDIGSKNLSRTTFLLLSLLLLPDFWV